MFLSVEYHIPDVAVTAWPASSGSPWAVQSHSKLRDVE